MRAPLPQLGLQRGLSGERPPLPAVGAYQVRQHQCVEAIVLANRGMVAFPSSSRDTGTHREHCEALAVDPLDRQPLAFLDRDSQEPVVISQQSDQPALIKLTGQRGEVPTPG